MITFALCLRLTLLQYSFLLQYYYFVAYQQPQQQQQQQQPEICGFELEQFLSCTKGQTDITLCQGFQDAWKQCRARYGVYN